MEIIAVKLREHLENKDKFRELASYFISNAVKEASQEQNPVLPPELLKSGLEMLCEENTNIIFACSESPIETIFLNSLALCFIRNGLPLVMASNIPHALSYIKGFKEELVNLNDLADWYEQRDSNYTNLDAYFRDQVNRGAMPTEERMHIKKCFYFIDG